MQVAPTSPLLSAIAEHLTFFGYNVSKIQPDPKLPSILSAEHSIKPWFWVMPIQNGAFFRTLYQMSAEADRDPLGFLTFLNNANSILIMSRFYRVENLLFVGAWYFGDYEKARFGIFFEQYIADIFRPGLTSPDQTSRYIAPASSG